MAKLKNAAQVEFKDKTNKCSECGNNFIFSAGEQKFYLEKAFAEPRRCPDCRKNRKRVRRKTRRALLRSLQADQQGDDVKAEESVQAGLVDAEPKQEEAPIEEEVKQDDEVPAEGTKEEDSERVEIRKGFPEQTETGEEETEATEEEVEETAGCSSESSEQAG